MIDRDSFQMPPECADAYVCRQWAKACNLYRNCPFCRGAMSPDTITHTCPKLEPDWAEEIKDFRAVLGVEKA